MKEYVKMLDKLFSNLIVLKNTEELISLPGNCDAIGFRTVF